jgi:hypothetical protein
MFWEHWYWNICQIVILIKLIWLVFVSHNYFHNLFLQRHYIIRIGKTISRVEMHVSFIFILKQCQLCSLDKLICLCSIKLQTNASFDSFYFLSNCSVYMFRATCAHNQKFSLLYIHYWTVQRCTEPKALNLICLCICHIFMTSPQTRDDYWTVNKYFITDVKVCGWTNLFYLCRSTKVLTEMEENAVSMTCNTHDEMKVHTLSSFNLEESNCKSEGGGGGKF